MVNSSGSTVQRRQRQRSSSSSRKSRSDIVKATEVDDNSGILQLFVPYATIFVILATMLHLIESSSLIDSIYLSVVCLSTVGFGDITPKTRLGKWVVLAASLIGVGLHANLVSYLATTKFNIFAKWSVVGQSLLCLFLGVVVFAYTEGWPLEDATYFIIQMSLTIGFGDITPATTEGKLFFVIYSFWSLYNASSIVAIMSASYSSTLSGLLLHKKIVKKSLVEELPDVLKVKRQSS